MPLAKTCALTWDWVGCFVDRPVTVGRRSDGVHMPERQGPVEVCALLIKRSGLERRQKERATRMHTDAPLREARAQCVYLRKPVVLGGLPAEVTMLVIEVDEQLARCIDDAVNLMRLEREQTGHDIARAGVRVGHELAKEVRRVGLEVIGEQETARLVTHASEVGRHKVVGVRGLEGAHMHRGVELRHDDAFFFNDALAKELTPPGDRILASDLAHHSCDGGRVDERVVIDRAHEVSARGLALGDDLVVQRMRRVGRRRGQVRHEAARVEQRWEQNRAHRVEELVGVCDARLVAVDSAGAKATEALRRAVKAAQDDGRAVGARPSVLALGARHEPCGSVHEHVADERHDDA